MPQRPPINVKVLGMTSSDTGKFQKLRKLSPEPKAKTNRVGCSCAIITYSVLGLVTDFKSKELHKVCPSPDVIWPCTDFQQTFGELCLLHHFVTLAKACWTALYNSTVQHDMAMLYYMATLYTVSFPVVCVFKGKSFSTTAHELLLFSDSERYRRK